LTSSEVTRLEQQSYDNIQRWTEAVDNSDSDAYSWEVSPPVDKPRLKRTIRKEFLSAANFDSLVLGAAPILQAPEPPTANGSSGATPPPLPPSASFMLAVNGQTYGPYTQSQLRQMAAGGQFAQQSLVWRPGMSEWQPASLVPELASLFTTVPAGMPPPPP
jgi:hypothetical protein